MKNQIFTLLFLLAMTPLFSQGIIKGVVVDDETNEPLIGASVLIMGTNVGTITDLDGSFELMDKSTVDPVLLISFLGYDDIQLTVSNRSDMADLGIINLPRSSFGLEEVVVTGVMDIVRDRRTPVAVSTINTREIQAKAVGNVEFPEAIKNTPSVYVSNQTGFGDSQMFLRGFDQINTAFLLNGQPINGMEDGRMYWSNWSGMSDVANAIQIQRGLGSSKLAISSVGGTINIVTKTVEKKAGGYARLMYGNDNYLKGSVAYNTGLKNKWAFSLLLDHWQADNKWAEGTKGQGQNYFMSVGYQPTVDHTFTFLVTGAPQWHGQRWSQSLETLEETPKFNQHWGEYDGEFETERRNFYHKPIINLSWDWDMNDASNLSSVLYASFGRGGGTGNYGSSSNRVRTEDGQVDWDAIAVNNTADSDGIGSYSDNYALRASMNMHQWFGNVTSFEHKFSDQLTWDVGLDLRFYTGDHFRQMVDMFGLDSYQDSYKHATRGSDYVVTEEYKARPWAALFNFADEDNRIAYDYSEDINYQGGFTQLEYLMNDFTAFVQGAVSNQSYQREGRWSDIGESEKVTKIGFNVKGGASYGLGNHSTVFVNAGHYSRQPFLDNIFEDIRGSNTLLTPDVENEKITGFEGGYKYQSNSLRVNLNGYHSSWGNRTNVSTFNNDAGTPDDETDDFNQREVERGLEQTHIGGELDIQYLLNTKIKFNAFTSVGNWTYNAIESLTKYNDDTGDLIETIDGDDISDVHITGTPQFSFGLGARAEIIDGLDIYADYNYYDKIYLRGNDDILREDVGTLDPFGLLNAGASYRLGLDGDRAIVIRANVYNLLNNDAINQSDRFGFFILNGTTWNTSVQYVF